MAEAHQARVQVVVEEMVQSLERDHIRKMQVGAYQRNLIYTAVLMYYFVRVLVAASVPTIGNAH